MLFAAFPIVRLIPSCTHRSLVLLTETYFDRFFNKLEAGVPVSGVLHSLVF